MICYDFEEIVQFFVNLEWIQISFSMVEEDSEMTCQWTLSYNVSFFSFTFLSNYRLQVQDKWNRNTHSNLCGFEQWMDAQHDWGIMEPPQVQQCLKALREFQYSVLIGMILTYLFVIGVWLGVHNILFYVLFLLVSEINRLIIIDRTT